MFLKTLWHLNCDWLTNFEIEKQKKIKCCLFHLTLKLIFFDANFIIGVYCMFHTVNLFPEFFFSFPIISFKVTNMKHGSYGHCVIILLFFWFLRFCTDLFYYSLAIRIMKLYKKNKSFGHVSFAKLHWCTCNEYFKSSQICGSKPH